MTNPHECVGQVWSCHLTSVDNELHVGVMPFFVDCSLRKSVECLSQNLVRSSMKASVTSTRYCEESLFKFQ